MSATAAPPLAIELRGITKRFPGVVANKDVNLSVARGEVHAVVGENGAGKSTLMKTIYGMYRPDEGSMLVDGRQVHFQSPGEAIQAGIGMVHQHFMLADNLTVLENIVLGSEPLKGGRIDVDRARRHIGKISADYGLGLRADALVEDLGVADRQRVEIAKVLYRGARILILDEPTAVLVPQEVDELFANLQELKREGLTVIFISHKLDEVLTVADTITVIRRGTTVTTVHRGEVTARDLARLMVGGELPAPPPRESTVAEQAVLEVEGLRLQAPGGKLLLDDVSFRIRRGEVLGIAGVEGNGQAELIESIMALRKPQAGTIRLGGQDITTWSTLHRREDGIGYIPEDRHRQGLLLPATLWENRILGYQTRPPAAAGILIDRAGARADTERIVRDYDVRTPSIDLPALALSGGNQQKLIVGRELSGEPKLLIASQPTRGVDVGAQAIIWGHIRQARAQGLAVLLISADLDELIGLSDTLRVIYKGRLAVELDPRNVTPEVLGAYMTGAAAERPARGASATAQGSQTP